MLSRALLVCFASVAVAATPPAPPPAVATGGGIRAPRRITVGPADQLLGVLGSDGKTYYYASNETATMQIFAVELRHGAPRLLFEEDGDASWPRQSPDGKWLAYISYAADAAGDLCVRPFETPTRVGKRRCLTGAGTAELQLAWLPGSRELAVVTRDGLHGDLELRAISVAGGKGRRLVAGSVAAPAFAPDGRSMAYVPVDRSEDGVGPSFAVHTAGVIHVAPLPSGAPTPVVLPLPGISASPAFSSDGKWLYFVQYLNDTNLDGVIDGNDRGVLFRMPFGAGRADAAHTEQLTAASWSCQYPAPAPGELVTTCLAQGSLDVYTLPLDGAIPAELPAAKLAEELAASTSPWEQLLILGHLRRLTPSPLLDDDSLRLHFRLGELESAGFVARNAAAAEPDPRRRRAAELLAELASARRGQRRLQRGQPSAVFVRDVEARLGRVAADLECDHDHDADNCALARLINAESTAILGKRDAAAATMASIPLERIIRPLVVALVARGAVELYRDLDDRAAVVDVTRRVAEHAALDHRLRLSFAADLIRQATRGRNAAARAAALADLTPKLTAGGDAAFLVAIDRALAGLTAATENAALTATMAMFKAEPDLERRRALVEEVIARADEAGCDKLAYVIGKTWVSSLPKDSALARRAESSYVESQIERAYADVAAGRVSKARERFEAIGKTSRWFEPLIGYLDDRLAEGKDPLVDLAARYAGKPNEPAWRFARAYLAARRLPELSDAAEFDRVSAAALADLAVAADQRPRNVELHQLWGYVAHRRWLQRGDRAAAVEADSHYLLAEDAAGIARARQRAAITIDLAQLQSSVGNHALALDWLIERAKLPYLTPERELLACLLHARALFFTSAPADETNAAARECVALLARAPSLARFRPLVLDRAALLHLATGDVAGARADYTVLAPLVADLPRARYTTQLGLGAAALGMGDAAAALAPLDAAERALDDAGVLERAFGATERGRPTVEELRVAGALLIAGLRAQALAAAGRVPDATTAAERRASLLRDRLLRHPTDDDQLALAETEGSLAALCLRAKNLDAARAHLESGLLAMDTFAAKTGTTLHATTLELLVAYAALAADGRLAGTAFTLDPRHRAATIHDALSRTHNPAWRKLHSRLTTALVALPP